MKFGNGIQNLIMTVMGLAAGAVCFRHVHDATVTFGQPSWVGWVNAVTVELMALALGLELRRRKRTGEPTGFVLAAMMAFIVVSLAAQVVKAQPSLGGWLAAAIPAVGFLVLVKVALSRKPVPVAQESPVQADATTVTQHVSVGAEQPVIPSQPAIAASSPTDDTADITEQPVLGFGALKSLPRNTTTPEGSHQ